MADPEQPLAWEADSPTSYADRPGIGPQRRFLLLMLYCLVALGGIGLLAVHAIEAGWPADTALSWVLGALLVIGVIGVYLTNWVSNGLSRVVGDIYEALNEVSDTHDWSIRLPVRGTDEFSRIADRLNNLFENMAQMDKHIRTNTSHLKQANSSLLEEVEARRNMELELAEKARNQELLIKRLEATQSQLIQAEKLASIGQLAAGVAHEINNPIGFVNSNLGTLRDYTRKLIGALEAYRGMAHIPEEEKSSIAERFDLAYITEDVPVLVQESMEGIDRVKKIVQDLKDFSHVDSGEWVAVNINKSIDSTLNIVRNEIKYKADVVREYGELPEIQVLGSQFNQVVLNLLVNAAHAIEKFGTITVRTRYEGDCIFVDVSDTGCGIPPENMKRIFDPFFTTKPIGTGTGLGLSLAFGIMKRMHGEISVTSEVGQGTCFTLRIPVDAAERDEPEDADGVTEGQGAQ
jgi:signal transduction histidine kinase